MGGFISTIRDIKVILRDLKITLKFTAKIVLKVHGIVDDVENTVQELKAAVNNLSARVPSNLQDTSQGKIIMKDKEATYLNEVVQCIETTADSVKNSLARAISVLTSDDLLKNTSDAFEDLVHHSGTNLSGVMARWASIPDEIGELVRQDCISLKAYAQTNNVKSMKEKAGDETVNNHFDNMKVSDKMDELGSKDDTTTSSENENKLVDKIQTPIPRRIFKETSFTEYGGIDMVEIPLSISDCHRLPKWHEVGSLPTQLNRKCRSEQHNDKGIVEPHDVRQPTGRDACSDPPILIQPEIFSLLMMTLLQEFSSEHIKAPQKAITMWSGGQNCKSLGQALMAECMSCD